LAGAVVGIIAQEATDWCVRDLTSMQYWPLTRPVWLLCLPLGIAVGLRWAGPKLGIRGRFWPTFGLTLTARVATVSLPAKWIEGSSADWVWASLPFLMLGSGLAGFLLSRDRVQTEKALASGDMDSAHPAGEKRGHDT
jgi:hypothetical protein